MHRFSWRKLLKGKSTTTEKKLGSPPNSFYTLFDNDSAANFQTTTRQLFNSRSAARTIAQCGSGWQPLPSCRRVESALGRFTQVWNRKRIRIQNGMRRSSRSLCIPRRTAIFHCQTEFLEFIKAKTTLFGSVVRTMVGNSYISRIVPSDCEPTRPSSIQMLA